MTIGFFHPINLLAVDVITLLEKFAKDGHKVVLITMQPYGHLHKELDGKGVIFEYLGAARTGRYQYYIGNGKKLANICKTYKIDFLYNNLAESQLIAFFARIFRPTPMVYYRHFPDNYILTCTKKEKFFETAIARLSKHILVPSATCIPFLKKYENVNLKKVTAINLTYSLEYYKKDDEKVNLLMNEKNDSGYLMLVSLARMVPVKRVHLQLQIAQQLKEAGVRFKFYILGNGPVYESLRQQLAENNLQDCCIMPGFVADVMTYLSAADILIHTSDSEASSHVIKEAGLMKKVVICCNGVGDFNSYLVNEKNAFLVNQDNPVDEVTAIITDIANKKIDSNNTGHALYETVQQKFTVDNVIDQHYKMINTILND